MIPRIFPRCLRGSCVKLFYLLVITGSFILLSHQFRSGQSHAKPIATKSIKVENHVNADGAVIEARDEEQHAPQTQHDDVPEVVVQIKPEVPRLKEVQSTSKPSGPMYIENERYPKLSSQGKFVPQRRIIHLDLKGAPYKVEFFTELFYFFKRIRATGILLEWEDMFPFTGSLERATNGNAYSMEDVESILKEAQRHHLEVIPLVQTFGHLEWILKLDKFAHLREDRRFPQVICFPMEEAWSLITSMIDQVASVHSKYGMKFFHMGADEAFQIGVCNASVTMMDRLGSRERLMLWHMSRTANYIKEKYEVTVLAWHDMIVQAPESDLLRFNLTQSIEPVLWSYAEDLDMYLPRSTWSALEPFRRVWGSSAWKGADGPGRFNSNPVHYIKNHESWVEQFSRVYSDFEVVQGIIMTGWSRYDHLATICELIPVGIPAMAMSMETMLEGRPLSSYPSTQELLECTPPTQMGFTSGCRFPGSKIYELINDYWERRKTLRQYRDEDFELNGWLSRAADSTDTSSLWYIDKVLPMVQYHAARIREIEKNLRLEMAKIYHQNTIDEFIYVYMGDDIEWLNTKLSTAEKINARNTFDKRPQEFPKTEL